MNDWMWEYNVFVRAVITYFHKGGSLKHLGYYLLALEVKSADLSRLKLR